MKLGTDEVSVIRQFGAVVLYLQYILLLRVQVTMQAVPMQPNPAGEHAEEPQRLFSKRVRRLLFYVGLFVLYSQLVSAGLTGVYRYSPWELSFVDGGNPEIFDPWTFTLLQPPEGIGTINDLQAIGWKIEYSPIGYALWAIVPPILGSAALLFASIARRGWLARCLLLLGSCLGVAAAIVIKLYEWGAGSIGWAFSHGIMTDMTLDNPPHPIYGYVELIGSLFLPIATYVRWSYTLSFRVHGNCLCGRCMPFASVGTGVGHGRESSKPLGQPAQIVDIGFVGADRPPQQRIVRAHGMGRC